MAEGRDGGWFAGSGIVIVHHVAPSRRQRGMKAGTCEA
jgi:hypothetical protein